MCKKWNSVCQWNRETMLQIARVGIKTNLIQTGLSGLAHTHPRTKRKRGKRYKKNIGMENKSQVWMNGEHRLGGNCAKSVVCGGDNKRKG